MAFPTRFLDELRSRVSLATVIGRTVKLTRKGREHSGLCPFHNEKTPSFTVAEEKGWFHCFGCGAHGDVIDFIMRTQHASFPEACEMLAQEAGLELPSDTPEERAKSVQRATMLEALEAACVFYQQQLQTAGGKQALTYLLGRGVNEESVTRFRLGWAPDARNSLRKALPADRFPDQLLVDVGLLHMGENGPDFDFFRGRIIFPITDARGRVIAFGARTLTDQQPKYLNSPETPLFKKGTNLYGYALARATVSEQQPAIVVEGYMDVIALHQHGFTGAMAPLGTALTEEQIEALWKLSPEPVLCLDGDTAGMGAFTGSIFGTGAIATSLSLDYTSAVGSGAQWSAVIAACLQIIELLGIAFFLKGLWMQQAVFDGKGHVSMGSAFTHMIFGVLGAKLPALVNLVQGSLKTSIFTVS